MMEPLVTDSCDNTYLRSLRAYIYIYIIYTHMMSCHVTEEEKGIQSNLLFTLLASQRTHEEI